MSEIRKTTTIKEIDVPPREPLISLADVLTTVGWVAFQGTKLAVKGAVAGTVLAYRGGTALASAIQQSRRKATFSEVTRIASAAGSAREAVTSLAAMSALEVPQRESRALVSKLETLVARNDKTGVTAVAHDLITARQVRLQAQLIPLVTEACRAIGFAPTGLTGQGIVAAIRQGTRQSLNINIEKAKDGGVQFHLDADGFEGGACVETLDALQTELRKRGVHCDLQERRRKQSRPVVDRGRIAHRIHTRCAQ